MYVIPERLPVAIKIEMHVIPERLLQQSYPRSHLLVTPFNLGATLLFRSRINLPPASFPG